MKKTIIGLCCFILLSGCDRGARGVKFIEGGGNAGSANSSKPKVEAIRNFSDGEIKTAIVGKTFQYTRPDGNGFVTYNVDGSFDYQDDIKGVGKGRWVITEGRYCESFGPQAVQECGDFKFTGDAYFAARSRLVEMKT